VPNDANDIRRRRLDSTGERRSIRPLLEDPGGNAIAIPAAICNTLLAGMRIRLWMLNRAIDSAEYRCIDISFEDMAMPPALPSLTVNHRSPGGHRGVGMFFRQSRCI